MAVVTLLLPAVPVLLQPQSSECKLLLCLCLVYSRTVHLPSTICEVLLCLVFIFCNMSTPIPGQIHELAAPGFDKLWREMIKRRNPDDSFTHKTPSTSWIIAQPFPDIGSGILWWDILMTYLPYKAYSDSAMYFMWPSDGKRLQWQRLSLFFFLFFGDSRLLKRLTSSKLECRLFTSTPHASDTDSTLETSKK